MVNRSHCGILRRDWKGSGLVKFYIKHLGIFWWILGNESHGPIGPYVSQSEAEETRIRLSRFERYEDEPGYVTTEGAR